MAIALPGGLFYTKDPVTLNNKKYRRDHHMKYIISALLGMVLWITVVQAVPSGITYQGKLQQNGQAVGGTLSMTFKVYNDPTSTAASALLWSTTNASVSVQDGIYSVPLGDDNNPLGPGVFSGDSVYIELTVSGDVLSPRTRVYSSGYALQAAGLSSTGVVSINAGSTERIVVLANGNVGIARPDPQYTLDVSGTVNATAVSANTFSLNGDQITSWPAGGGGSVWTESGGNINRSSGSVGVGTASPATSLDVRGTVQVDDALYLREDSDAVIGFNHPDSTYDRRLRITAGKDDGVANSQGACIDLHGNNRPQDTGNGGELHLVAGSSGGQILFYGGGGPSELMRVAGNGDVTIASLSSNGAVYSNGGVLTNTDPSSREYKENIAPKNLNAKRLLQLQPKSYTWKKTGQDDFGFIAEEIKTIIPELYRDDGTTKGYLSQKLIFYVIELLKEQQKEIDILKERIQEFEK